MTKHKIPAKILQRQQLADLEKRLSSDLGDYLVLRKEGSAKLHGRARQKVKAALIKARPDMEKLAKEMGEPFPQTVACFLDCIDALVHNSLGMVDNAQIDSCFKATRDLEDRLAS